jgi:hypothetical protein
MFSILHKPQSMRVRVKLKSKTYKCLGGYCELSEKQVKRKEILSKDEGIAPRFKMKEYKEYYKLSYPGDEKIQAVVIEPMYITWMGRRWYTSP